MIEDVFGRGWESDVIGRATHDWVHGREAAKFGSPELSVDDWSTFMLANLSVVAAVVRTRLVLQTKVDVAEARTYVPTYVCVYVAYLKLVPISFDIR